MIRIETTQKIIETLETRLRTAMLSGDVTVLDELIASELMFVSPDGQVLDKSADIEAHRSGTLKLQRFDIGDQRLQLWESFAVVSVKAELEGTFAGHPFAGTFRYTRVWARRGKQWQIVAGHASEIKRQTASSE